MGAAIACSRAHNHPYKLALSFGQRVNAARRIILAPHLPKRAKSPYFADRSRKARATMANEIAPIDDDDQEGPDGKTLSVVLEIPERIDKSAGVDWFKPPPGPGNPTYTAETAAEILRRHASGETIRFICNEINMPAHQTWNWWVTRSPALAASYGRAKKLWAESMLGEALDAARNAVDRDSAAAAKVRVDACLRIAAMVDPAKWSEKRVAPKVEAVLVITNIGQKDRRSDTIEDADYSVSYPAPAQQPKGE